MPCILPPRKAAPGTRHAQLPPAQLCPCPPAIPPAAPLVTARRVRAENAERINTFIALQFLFDHFWKSLKVVTSCHGGWGQDRDLAQPETAAWRADQPGPAPAPACHGKERSCCPASPPAAPPSALPPRPTPTPAASAWWATCPSMWAGRAPMCGPTAACLSCSPTAPPRLSGAPPGSAAGGLRGCGRQASTLVERRGCIHCCSRAGPATLPGCRVPCPTLPAPLPFTPTPPPPTRPRSGVPPDAFSATGQLWGSPLYDWKAHAAEGFAWWRQRIARSMQARPGRAGAGPLRHPLVARKRWALGTRPAAAGRLCGSRPWRRCACWAGQPRQQLRGWPASGRCPNKGGEAANAPCCSSAAAAV